ncbi:ATP-binding cassette domain-containing protein [Mycoplasma enhydrae]|uniref:ATP-binding cassette domain-containing protein n=1 Tax=Mycoplasma enhydrae TaxID=2499220 RepID=UPI00197C6071|nr:ATP-binding cassette domain-containing protein [Mycoplasma enhydrae]MBN4089191.1 ATP-binding cassette domain-containing protein [Mycoplasma enhydrae]MCV3733855.1 ATP-binding cassette domain-containing protein [Mycoplasma enhydrae]MCV3753713.1 ATP-binding cassette domain-containing protein [Mycoplasma enhydrae]
MKNNNDRKVILSIDNLKKYFVNQGVINKAVDGVSFDVHEGEIVGLIGESGSGKTTVGRTILRLYDEYNGFVRLEDKIISGKNISYSLKKYLRKNVQMIFQDPHASLNSQQNIYTILKEPLLVNGIMKSRIDDIFADWLDVKKNFKYTFQIQAMKLELQNYKEINKLARPFFSKWQNIFKDFGFEEEISIEDNFSSFYAYLEEKQQMESAIINNMYSNSSTLIEYYYQMQAKYRNQDLSKEELDYDKAKKKYALIKILNTISKNRFDLLKQKHELLKTKKELEHSYKDKLRESKNTFYNYRVENKHEKTLVNIAKLMSTNLEFYLYNLKNEYLFKKRIEILKELQKSLKLLDFEDIKKLVRELEDYVKDFYENKLIKIEYTKTSKLDIVQMLEKEFNFKFDSYKKISDKNTQEWAKKFADINDKIQKVNAKLAIKDSPEYSQEQLQEAQKDLEKAKKIYEKGRADFLVSYKQTIEELYNQIKEQKDEYNNLVALQDYCNEMYEKFKLEFFEFVKKHYNAKIDTLKIQLQTISKTDKKAIKKLEAKIAQIKKDLDTTLKMYHSDVSLKEDTLKSFHIEKKYLNRDIKNIYILLGIDNKWVELNLTKQNHPDNDISSKWVKRFNIFDYKISFFIAKYLISELLYKTIIYRSLEDVGLLKQFAYRYPHEFSGGQLQRIVIARALITEPKVIVADEPIASLDISIQAQVVNLLKELCVKKNIGLIFIAHDLSMIEYVADNVQIMHLGKIVESGNTEAIYSKPLHPYTINLFKAIPKISNANEKFQNVSFALDYIYEQQFPNVPETFKIDDNHYIYGTEAQVKLWTDNKYTKK